MTKSTNNRIYENKGLYDKNVLILESFSLM